MKAKEIRPNVYSVGAVDWDRRLFDALVPLPDGTSYNAYLIQGSEKIALIDSVDPSKWEILQYNLERVQLDFLIANHVEQDHSGCLPHLLERYPQAVLLCSDKAKPMLVDHLHVDPERVRVVTDGETLSLGGKTLRFLYLPWVHWPETMGTYLEEERILFPCDFFGSHFATSSFLADLSLIKEPTKRYFAEIMMPFRSQIEKNLEKLASLPLAMIAPSHGPAWDQPQVVMDWYREWISPTPENIVVVPYVSMHGSTRLMAEYLGHTLTEKGVRVELFDLPVTDIGKLAMSLVDAATVLGSCTVLTGPHPLAAYAAFLANALRPKARWATVIGSYGWASRAVEALAGAFTMWKPEILPPVYIKGLPRSEDYARLDELAAAIVTKHHEVGLAA
jgi:flavorubredoxin